MAWSRSDRRSRETARHSSPVANAEWARWLGPGDPEPHPTACIVVADEIVGWIDADPERTFAVDAAPDRAVAYVGCDLAIIAGRDM